MATSTPVSIPIPSSRPALSWQDRVQRFLLRDRTLGYIFLTPSAASHPVCLVAYPFVNAVLLTFQQKTAGAPGRFIGLDNYRELLAYGGVLAHGVQHRCSTPALRWR